MAYIAGYNPVFTRPEGWESMTHQQLWEKVAYHSYTYELEFDRPAGRAEQGTEQADLGGTPSADGAGIRPALSGVRSHLRTLRVRRPIVRGFRRTLEPSLKCTVVQMYAERYMWVDTPKCAGLR